MNDWVIIGCGYVGTRLARKLLAGGQTVRALSRHPEKLAPLTELGARVQHLEATKARAFGPALYGAKNPIVVYSIPPLGNMPAGEGVRRASEAALGVGAQRFIYLSSTAVYGPSIEGEVVDEDSPLALSDGEASSRISEESAVEGAHLSGLPTVILRMAAIYGPGRGVRERLKAGNYKLVDEGGHMFSRVHVDDVVGIIMTAADRAPNPAIYCVSDDRPTTQREYADWLVARMGAKPPPSVPSLAPGMPRRPVRNRAVGNARVKSQLGYTFQYPSYLEGEPAIERELGQAASTSVEPAKTVEPAKSVEPAPLAQEDPWKPFEQIDLLKLLKTREPAELFGKLKELLK
jgi:nucleoside-diphosphate-sugar epimerase